MLRAFHNDPTTKAMYLARLKAHAKADEIIHGIGWEKGRGCAVGCTLNKYDHHAYETELGLPEWLARLEDALFEGQTNGDSLTFPIRFLEAIPVGADVSMVMPQFLHWLLVDKQHGVIRFATTPDTRKAVQDVADLYQAWIKTGARPAARAAWAAAGAAGEAGAAGAAGEAARAAGEAGAAWEAMAAAKAAARAARAAGAAWEAAWAAYSTICANYLLTLLKAAPVPKQARGGKGA